MLGCLRIVDVVIVVGISIYSINGERLYGIIGTRIRRTRKHILISKIKYRYLKVLLILAVWL